LKTGTGASAFRYFCKKVTAGEFVFGQTEYDYSYSSDITIFGFSANIL